MEFGVLILERSQSIRRAMRTIESPWERTIGSRCRTAPEMEGAYPGNIGSLPFSLNRHSDCTRRRREKALLSTCWDPLGFYLEDHQDHQGGVTVGRFWIYHRGSTDFQQGNTRSYSLTCSWSPSVQLDEREWFSLNCVLSTQLRNTAAWKFMGRFHIPEWCTDIIWGYFKYIIFYQKFRIGSLIWDF